MVAGRRPSWQAHQAGPSACTLHGLRWSASSPMLAPRRWRIPTFHKSISAPGREPIRIWPSSCAGAWIPPRFRSRRAIWFNPSTRSFPSSARKDSRMLYPALLRNAGSPWKLFCSSRLTALLLAGIGVYGTISYIVSGRTRDIGIRIALGAQRKTILHMVLSQGLTLALAGAAVGLDRRIDCVAPDGGIALRRLAQRSSHLYQPHCCPRHCGACGLLYSRAPRYAGRPHCCFARGVNLRPK